VSLVEILNDLIRRYKDNPSTFLDQLVSAAMAIQGPAWTRNDPNYLKRAANRDPIFNMYLDAYRMMEAWANRAESPLAMDLTMRQLIPARLIQFAQGHSAIDLAKSVALSQFVVATTPALMKPDNYQTWAQLPVIYEQLPWIAVEIYKWLNLQRPGFLLVEPVPAPVPSHVITVNPPNITVNPPNITVNPPNITVNPPNVVVPQVNVNLPQPADDLTGMMEIIDRELDRVIAL